MTLSEIGRPWRWSSARFWRISTRNSNKRQRSLHAGVSEKISRRSGLWIYLKHTLKARWSCTSQVQKFWLCHFMIAKLWRTFLREIKRHSSPGTSLIQNKSPFSKVKEKWWAESSNIMATEGWCQKTWYMTECGQMDWWAGTAHYYKRKHASGKRLGTCLPTQSFGILQSIG